jgi:hypothetical protein
MTTLDTDPREVLRPHAGPDGNELLGELPADVTIAVDTEYHDTHTLTIQTAARIDAETLAVQVYRSTAVPNLPADFDDESFLPPDRYGRVVVRPVRPISPDLSPTRMYQDLFDVPALEILSRKEGTQLQEHFGEPGIRMPSNVGYDKRGRRWRVPSLNLTVVGHFLTADFCRLWGRQFLDDLLADGVAITARKLIQFDERGRRYGAPTVEYAALADNLFGVCLWTRDTILPYGPHPLDALSKTFLGFGKSETLDEQDKADMLRTFRCRTADAYGYAMADALNTLLVFEQMQAKDREIYRSFGFREEEIPPLRPTLGSRVSTFLVGATRQAAGKCQALPSDRSLKDLMSRGGMTLLKAHPNASRYGTQTGKVHGGLLYSRSPTKFWHASPGMLRDVDMAGCYQHIIAGINVYWGRPLIFEPGNRPLTLKEAAALTTQNADPDGWLVRVSGDLRGIPNALIPSTDNAVTSANYRSKLRKGRRLRARKGAFHLEALQDPASVKGTSGSRLYAARVESGVVTWATWLLIRALPQGLREQYEGLNADTVILYPRCLAARDGKEFDALVRKHQNQALPWEDELDLGGLEQVRRERIDADFVTLKFPIGEYARRIGEYRKRAQLEQGKGSGADLSWKVHANSMYGVLGSAYLPTNNFLAGNVITAQGRAEAFAMGQALNAIQTITDGCTYRRDQIPACTFAECLRRRPDYPIRRAEDGGGIPFLDPRDIPEDDAGFTQWYRGHVKQFFGVTEPAYDRLFDTHALEHKKTGTTPRAEFDGLACDGAGNYLKATLAKGGQWEVKQFAARSYCRESKQLVQSWLVPAYSGDKLTELPPVTENRDLLTFEQAGREARRALEGGIPAVVYPLRVEHKRVAAYKAVKESAFVFRTPEQRAAILKHIQKFEKRAGAGLELLCLRRTYGGRRQGSLSDLAEQLYDFIRQGETNLHKHLNLAKLKGVLSEVIERRLAEIKIRKKRAEADLLAKMDARRMDPSQLATAYVLSGGGVAA